MKLRTPKAAFAAVLSAALLASSCRAGFLFDLWDDFLTLFLDISPTVAVLEPNQSIILKARGGHSPYIFDLTGGSGTLTDNLDGTAEYIAPGSATDAVILLSDSRGEEVLANIMVSGSAISLLSISPTSASLLYGETLDFDASGGQGTYEFSPVSGLGSVDSVTGLYTAPSQDTNAVVQVEDDSGQAAQAVVTVRAAAQALAIAPVTLTLEEGATFQFSATGGTPSAVPPPYTYLASAGSIVAGTGLFTAPAAPATVTVTVTDSALPVPATAAAAVEVVATAALLTIVPRSINVTLGSTFQFDAEGGILPYTYTMGTSYGGTVTPSGLYTAPTSKQGVEYVIVTDGRGITDTATVKVRKK